MYRGFIKDIKNLSGRALGMAELRIISFNISRDILTKATSSFTVIKVPDEAQIGYVFGMYDEYGKIVYLGVITEIVGTEITTDQIISIFDDKWLWNNPNESTIEGTVAQILINDFANNSDTLVSQIFNQFDILVSSTGTALTLPTENENEVTNFMSFIFELYENYGILLDIDIPYNPETPSITVKKPSYPILKLGDNNEVLINFNIQEDTFETNKLIVYSAEGAYRGTWYGSLNGITTDSTSAARLPKVKTNIVFSDDPAEDLIADNLSADMYNHKITVDLVIKNKLYDFNDFNLGQQFIIYHNGEVYESILTGYSLSVDDYGKADIVSLVFGKVRTTLTNKLNKMIKSNNAFNSNVFLKKSGGVITGTVGFESGQNITLVDGSGQVIGSMTTDELFSGGSVVIPIATDTVLGGIFSGNDITVGNTGLVTVDHATEADDLPLTIITNAVTRTSGASITEQKLVKYGKVCQLQLRINTISTSAGNNLFVGTLAEAYRPIVYTTGSSYTSQRNVAGLIEPSGAITIRNANTVTINAGQGIAISFTFIID